MQSIWSDSIHINDFPKLDGNTRTHVLVIGGGMAGILCAHALHQRGVDYLLVEGDRIGGGVTKNTTAKITAQHGLLYDKLIRDMGMKRARQYLNANLWAVERYRELCTGLDCDFEDKDAYVFALRNPAAIEREVRAVNALGYPAELAYDIPLPLDVKAAIRFPSQAQFNPLKFIAAISEGLNVREQTFVRKVDGHTAYTPRGNITFRKLIVATHYPLLNLAGLYSVKLYQHRSYVIALDHAPDVDGMYVDEAENGMSFRNYGGLLLVGGGDHRTGKSGGNWRELRNFAHTRYPGAVERYVWATQDCMSLDGVPYIGALSSLYPDAYVATGFNKWGMTSSMVAAHVLSDAVTGVRNAYADVFRPDRSVFTKQLSVNLIEAASNLLTFGPKRCTHLGCALKWNKQEHTWDCPCHGSRFHRDGTVIDNPAKKPLR